MRPMKYAAVATLALALAACGSSSSSKTTTTPTSAAATTAAATAAATTAASTPSAAATSAGAESSSTASAATSNADTDHLKTLGLQQTDVPAAYKASGDGSTSTGPDSTSSNKQLSDCVGAKDTSPDQVAEASSADFTSGSSTISSKVDLFKSQDDVDNDKTILASDKAKTCVQTLLTSAITSEAGSSAKVSDVSIDLTKSPSGVPSNVVAKVTASLTVTLQGQSPKVGFTIYFITGPKIEGQVSFESLGAASTGVDEASIVSTVADRVGKG